MDRRGFVLAFLALGGCATVGAPVAPPGPLAELEPLLAVRTGPDGVTIRVASAGCTARPDFTFYVERRAGAVSLAFARKHVDVCKAGGGQAEIVFGWTELGVAPRTPVVLLNPMAPPRA
ncbi:hypothetical protein [Phenylobacterium sp.]|uniref:hypothetical protein n=1 Tax=Phenylobacterium sp. TaxID=1871053 RepID=UPI0012256B63|nr:hypothetical protein [Phenylobacterium sp.]THD61484.1 MAG: hypothetical protein E8A49_10910 [Phenylobacterium sp.]